MRYRAISSLQMNRRKIAATTDSARRQFRSNVISVIAAKPFRKPHHINKPADLAVGDVHWRQLDIRAAGRAVAEILEITLRRQRAHFENFRDAPQLGYS